MTYEILLLFLEGFPISPQRGWLGVGQPPHGDLPVFMLTLACISSSNPNKPRAGTQPHITQISRWPATTEMITRQLLPLDTCGNSDRNDNCDRVAHQL